MVARNGVGQHKGQERPEGRVVRLADLSVGYSPRQTRVDEDHVAALAEVVDRLPPIVVDERTMRVIDGGHRVEAFRRMGRTEIRALLFSGSETDALVVAVQANIKHGKPLSRSERQAAAGTLLLRCPDRSDRWVAEVCGLSHSTVARIRQAAEAMGSGIRTGRDGRRRPVDPTAGQGAIAKALADEPASSVRQAAQAAGVAPSTAHRLAAGLRVPRKLSPARPAPSAPVPSLGFAIEVVDLGGPPSVRSDAAAWLARTAVTPEDVRLYLEEVPLGRIYEVADELRRRARTWSEMAEALERRARPCRPARSE